MTNINNNLLDDVEEFLESTKGVDLEDKASDSPIPTKEPHKQMIQAENAKKNSIISQYASLNGLGFIPTSSTVKTLPTDCYFLSQTMNGDIVFMSQKLVTDKLLRLPDSRSDEVVAEVQKFWSLKETFKRFGFAHKRGFLLFGPPGCHAKGTKILMANGSTKLVEDVVVGDQLMGPDSEPRDVLELRRGIDRMVKIIPTKGDPFVVNQHHILHLEPTHTQETVRCPINISVKDIMENTNIPFKDRFKLIRKEVKFEEKNLKIPPYIMGLWLGDGTRTLPELTTMDQEIADEWIKYGYTLNLKTRISKQQINSKASSYTFSSNINGSYRKGTNLFINKLREYNLLGYKFIPKDYLTSSRDQRLELLAGLIDTDGSSGTGTKTKFGTGYDYITKDKQLADDVVYLSRSLGFAAYIKNCIKGCYVGKHKYFEGEYYRIYISGDLSRVPVRLERKKCKVRKSIKNVKRTGFQLEVLPNESEYYGFTLNRDYLYLTDDFIVHHNSGKTSTVAIITNDMVKKGGIVIISDAPGLLAKGLAQLRNIEPERPIVVIMEDIDTIVRRYGESEVLALLDGESQIENVVYIATTNYPENLDGRITNRPSRFDRIVKIGMPNAAARELYIRSRLDHVENEGINLIEATEGLSIAHIKELIISVYCQGNPVKETLDRLSKMKIMPKSDQNEGMAPMGISIKAPW